MMGRCNYSLFDKTERRINVTHNEVTKVLSYVAQNIISPLAFDDTPAKEVWLRLSGEEFNKFCEFMYKMETRKTLPHPTCFGKPITYNGMAENGCDGCPFEIECDAIRSYSSKR
jgi:hypothetical protein